MTRRRAVGLEVIEFALVFIVVLAAIGLLAAENISGSGTWLTNLGTMLQNNAPLLGLIIVVGTLAAVMGYRRK